MNIYITKTSKDYVQQCIPPFLYIHMFIVCVCVRERERARARDGIVKYAQWSNSYVSSVKG
jgi:hypothetical protein